jgi:hypothetical protein
LIGAASYSVTVYEVRTFKQIRLLPHREHSTNNRTR